MVAVSGCSTAVSRDADSGPPPAAPDAAAPDASQPDAGIEAPDAAPPDPYRHTIAVDGESSFNGDEVFATTTPSFSAYASWDQDNLYLGYLGADVAANDAGKWLLVYLDVDLGGSDTGQRYNTQAPAFPTGFGADLYYRRQSTGAIEDVRDWTGSGWQASDVEPTSARSGDMLEVSLPLAGLGNPERIGVVALWINETGGVEAAYGGLYDDSFTDGYHASIPVTRYLEIDLASARPPNDAANRRP